MKNLFLFTLLSISIISNIYAQEEDTSTSFIDKLTFGIKGGPTISTSGSGATEANPNEKDGARTQISFHFGGTAELKLTENLSFQTELLYSNEKSQTQKKDENYEASYIQVPLLIKFYISQNFSIEAGPQVGFLLSSDLTTSGNRMNTGNLKSTEFRITGGLSYRLKNGFNFGGRYDVYLTDPENEIFNTGFEVPFSSFRNGLINGYIGYTF